VRFASARKSIHHRRVPPRSPFFVDDEAETDAERRALAPAILAAIAALAVYAVTLAGGYVYDDRYIVLADPRVANVAAGASSGSRDYFLGGADNLYRPLVSMSYAVQARLHGTATARAWLFHAVQLAAAHGRRRASVAELARRMTRSLTIATIARLLFAVHPIHVEAVANIVGRRRLMCAWASSPRWCCFSDRDQPPRARRDLGLHGLRDPEQGAGLAAAADDAPRDPAAATHRRSDRRIREHARRRHRSLRTCTAPRHSTTRRDTAPRDSPAHRSC
jgi:hypothetical protein